MVHDILWEITGYLQFGCEGLAEYLNTFLFENFISLLLVVYIHRIA